MQLSIYNTFLHSVLHLNTLCCTVNSQNIWPHLTPASQLAFHQKHIFGSQPLFEIVAEIFQGLFAFSCLNAADVKKGDVFISQSQHFSAESMIFYLKKTEL